MIDPRKTITAAKELAAHFGWAVFPVNPKTKKVAKGEVIDDSRVELNMHVKPLVVWLWLGGLVMVVGTLISLWPKSRKRKTS